MKSHRSVILFLVFASFSLSVIAQSKALFIGIGASPLHGSIQSDFTNMSVPVRGFLAYKLGHVALEASYEENSGYDKDRFSFTNITPALSLLFFAKKNLQEKHFYPYLKTGINYKTTSFTTEGYPGITGYELKVEKDQSIGFGLGAGAKYLINKFLLGVETHYSKNQAAQFLAGGFTPQNLNTDHFTFELNITIPIKTIGKRASLTACPNL